MEVKEANVDKCVYKCVYKVYFGDANDLEKILNTFYANDYCIENIFVDEYLHKYCLVVSHFE